METNQYTERLAALDADIAYVTAEMHTISEARGAEPLTDEDKTRWDEGAAFIADAEAQIPELKQRADIAAKAIARQDAPSDFQIIRTPDKLAPLNDRNTEPAKLNDHVLRSLEEHDTDDTNVRKVFKRHKADVDYREWVRGLAVRATDPYESAFAKYMTGRSHTFTEEERAAVSATTAAEGGSMVPTHLDPTLILTSDGSGNLLRPISRVVTTIGRANVWNGITTAGVVISGDAPQTEVSDDTHTVGAPSVTVHKAQGLVQAELEALDDIAGLPNDVLMLFADARDVYEGAMHCTGSGTNTGFGIFTALDANTNVEITSTTAATIGNVDIQAVRRAVPQRFRNRSTWVYNPIWGDAIKNLGTAVSATYSRDLTQANTETLLNRPVIETDDAPEVLTTTALDNRLVLGDFQNFVIVDKPGSFAIQFIPALFNTTTNLPDGRVAWYMHYRTGSDSVNDLAFRLLQDKTSA